MATRSTPRWSALSPEDIAVVLERTRALGGEFKRRRNTLRRIDRSQETIAEEARVSVSWLALVEAGQRKQPDGTVLPFVGDPEKLMALADVVEWDRAEMLTAAGIDPSTIAPTELVADTPEPSPLDEVINGWPRLDESERDLIRRTVKVILNLKPTRTTSEGHRETDVIRPPSLNDQ